MENNRIVTAAGIVVAGLTFALFVYAQTQALPITMRAQLAPGKPCGRPTPATVKILAGAEVRKEIPRGPGAEDLVRNVIATELATLAQRTADKYQRGESPYENEKPLACPQPDRCQVTVKGTFVTEPPEIPVTYDETTGMSTGIATVDFIAEASCAPKR